MELQESDIAIKPPYIIYISIYPQRRRYFIYKTRIPTYSQKEQIKLERLSSIKNTPNEKLKERDGR